MTCTEDVDECDGPNPCHNDGVCRNIHGSFSCQCTARHRGDACEYERNYCTSRPCQNGAGCVPTYNGGIAGYTCGCADGDRGQHCEVLSRNFEPLSYIEYDLTVNQPRNSIELEFRTYRSDALLLYLTGGPGNHQSAHQYIALEVMKGQVRFSFLTEQTQPVRVTVNTRVDTGEWFHVEAVRNSEVFPSNHYSVRYATLIND